MGKETFRNVCLKGPDLIFGCHHFFFGFNILKYGYIIKNMINQDFIQVISEIDTFANQKQKKK